MTEPGNPFRIAVAPVAPQPIADAVVAGGGVLDLPDHADAIVWTDPSDPKGLAVLLASSPAQWIQLPFAGIESFFDAGVIDPSKTWTCAKGIYGHATAEQALALMLAAARQLTRHARTKAWLPADGSDHRRLAGTTAVIVGTGGIGQALASMLSPLRVRILAVSKSGRGVDWAERTVAQERLDDVISEADWLVIAAAYTQQTHHMIDAKRIALLPGSAWIINVARGGLVDTAALVGALQTKQIGGAALDVTDPEPLPEDHPLWNFDNVLITSHTANTHAMAIPELAAMVERNVRAAIAGRPLEGVVDPSAGY